MGCSFPPIYTASEVTFHSVKLGRLASEIEAPEDFHMIAQLALFMAVLLWGPRQT